MKKNWLKIALLLAAAGFPAPGRAEETQAEPPAATELGGKVSGFTFVLPGKSGEKQSVVRGDTANFLENGIIEVVNVKAQIFRQGQSDVFITSPKADFNKMTREVTTEEPVEIQMQEMIINGTGLKYDPNSNKARLSKNVTVKIFSKPKGMNL